MPRADYEASKAKEQALRRLTPHDVGELWFASYERAMQDGLEVLNGLRGLANEIKSREAAVNISEIILNETRNAIIEDLQQRDAMLSQKIESEIDRKLSSHTAEIQKMLKDHQRVIREVMATKPVPIYRRIWMNVQKLFA